MYYPYSWVLPGVDDFPWPGVLGGRGFSLVPREGVYAIISSNLQLLLPTKSVVAYARKQSRSTIFEWQEMEKGWYLYVGEFPSS